MFNNQVTFLHDVNEGKMESDEVRVDELVDYNDKPSHEKDTLSQNTEQVASNNSTQQSVTNKSIESLHESIINSYIQYFKCSVDKKFLSREPLKYNSYNSYNVNSWFALPADYQLGNLWDGENSVWPSQDIGNENIYTQSMPSTLINKTNNYDTSFTSINKSHEITTFKTEDILEKYDILREVEDLLSREESILTLKSYMIDQSCINSLGLKKEFELKYNYNYIHRVHCTNWLPIDHYWPSKFISFDSLNRPSSSGNMSIAISNKILVYVPMEAAVTLAHLLEWQIQSFFLFLVEQFRKLEKSRNQKSNCITLNDLYIIFSQNQDGINWWNSADILLDLKFQLMKEQVEQNLKKLN